jgi:VWFA-related protein
VDLTAVAYDAKGVPLTDLKPQDFELFDNGRPQKLRIVACPGIPSVSASAASETQTSFSNQPGTLSAANADAIRSESSLTVLLIDSAHLSWPDLSNARQQMISFLRQLPDSVEVGIYIMKSGDFQILQEPTTNHGLLMERLSHWMPRAADLAQAQEEERRNRRQMDYVRHKSDLQYVNGNMISAPESFQPPDPQLRDQGSNAGREALSLFPGIARHLAVIPEHKNLVWITSDNVLADWEDKAIGTEKGDKQISGFVLRVQEAMNEAHDALFPLDASQLEGGDVRADIQNASVQVDPGAVNLPPGGRQPAASTLSDPHGGRNLAAMVQDVHSVQGPIRDMADATGGRAFRRAGDMISTLNHVVEDGRATYLISFVPDTVADEKYHSIQLKVVTRRGVALRYRTGYFASAAPSSFQERFQEALWQPGDVNQIGLRATPIKTGNAWSVKLAIAGADLALRQGDGRWVDRIDLFFAQRDSEGRHARLAGKTITLALTPSSYQALQGEGLPFSQALGSAADVDALRVLVVDENSGRIGSVTLPGASREGPR